MIKKPALTFPVLYSIYTGLMPLIMSGLVSVWAYNHIALLKTLDNGTLIIIWISLSLAMGLSLIPTTFVALITGYIWGILAIFPLIISYVLATIIGSSISKWVDNEQIINQINKNPKAKNILQKLQNEQFKIVALARLSPVFPFGISNVIFTYLGVPLKNLIFAGIIGMLPRTSFMVWASGKAESLQSLYNAKWTDYLQSPLFYLGIIATFLLIWIVYRIVKKR
jgi:uncharacterized membrane protein YdjX (TVP38/TMEM64 family)